MGPGRVLDFFENGQPLPTNISSVKVIKLLPTKYSSVNVIHSKKKFIGDLTKMSSILTALNGRFNGSDQNDR